MLRAEWQSQAYDNRTGDDFTEGVGRNDQSCATFLFLQRSFALYTWPRWRVMQVEAANGIIYGRFFFFFFLVLKEIICSQEVQTFWLNRVNQELLIFSRLSDTTSVPQRLTCCSHTCCVCVYSTLLGNDRLVPKCPRRQSCRAAVTWAPLNVSHLGGHRATCLHFLSVALSRANMIGICAVPERLKGGEDTLRTSAGILWQLVLKCNVFEEVMWCELVFTYRSCSAGNLLPKQRKMFSLLSALRKFS